MTDEFVRAGTLFYMLGYITLFFFDFYCVSKLVSKVLAYLDKRFKKKQEGKQSIEEDTK